MEDPVEPNSTMQWKLDIYCQQYLEYLIHMHSSVKDRTGTKTDRSALLKNKFFWGGLKTEMPSPLVQRFLLVGIYLTMDLNPIKCYGLFTRLELSKDTVEMWLDLLVDFKTFLVKQVGYQYQPSEIKEQFMHYPAEIKEIVDEDTLEMFEDDLVQRWAALEQQTLELDPDEFKRNLIVFLVLLAIQLNDAYPSENIRQGNPSQFQLFHTQDDLVTLRQHLKILESQKSEIETEIEAIRKKIAIAKHKHKFDYPSSPF
ncbi:hypothetical protein EDD86DRAFT_249847 [Gorgonomyces haynaldii]|nr:hypothetical protein EDD86DRAFT_249847 [Gorgonomyces haynaldii]